MEMAIVQKSIVGVVWSKLFDSMFWGVKMRDIVEWSEELEGRVGGGSDGLCCCCFYLALWLMLELEDLELARR